MKYPSHVTVKYIKKFVRDDITPLAKLSDFIKAYRDTLSEQDRWSGIFVLKLRVSHTGITYSSKYNIVAFYNLKTHQIDFPDVWINDYDYIMLCSLKSIDLLDF